MLRVDRRVLRMNRRVLRVDRRVLRMNRRVLRVDRRVLRVDRRVLRMNRRVLQVDRRVLQMNTRVLRLEQFAKLHAFRAYIPYVPTCLRALCAYAYVEGLVSEIFALDVGVRKIYF